MKKREPLYLNEDDVLSKSAILQMSILNTNLNLGQTNLIGVLNPYVNEN